VLRCHPCRELKWNKLKGHEIVKMLENALLAQGLSLVAFLAQSILACLLHLPVAIFKSALGSFRNRESEGGHPGCTFYEGIVFHERLKPVHNAFRSLLSPSCWQRFPSFDANLYQTGLVMLLCMKDGCQAGIRLRSHSNCRVSCCKVSLKPWSSIFIADEQQLSGL
jgi:hypothetical protein